jgi:Zn-dependent M28 family amino/carboxypeptidase
MIRHAFVVLCLGFATIAQAASHFDGNRWWNTVKLLADDKFEGRDTGSAGERGAEEYIVTELKALGVKPAGLNGYYQPVKLTSREIVAADSSLALVTGTGAEPLRLGEQAILFTRFALAPRVEAPLVFVGYGLSIPEHNYDDFKNLDLKGKLAVVFSGSPAEVPSALAAHYQSLAERWKALKAAGAIGLVIIPNPAAMDLPWARVSINWTHPSMELVGEEFNETAGAQLAVMVNPEFAELLFRGSGHTFAEIAALGKDRKPLPRFLLAGSMRAVAHTQSHEVESRNVVAQIQGSDPKLKSEYVVLSAHIDHVGIGAPVNGDRIYNGAMDDGSGSALLLEMARFLKHSPTRLKRSVLFVWVTGEEKGLLGSKYFAAHPSVPAASMVADINTDMFLPLAPLKILTVYGLAESDLGDHIAAVAARLGLTVQPDPEPLRNIFIRSDQYNFVCHGVPSLMISSGFKPGGAEEKLYKDWLMQRYHAPSDDGNQPVDLAAAADFEEVIHALTVAVANEPARPRWKTESFFRRFADQPSN